MRVQTARVWNLFLVGIWVLVVSFVAVLAARSPYLRVVVYLCVALQLALYLWGLWQVRLLSREWEHFVRPFQIGCVWIGLFVLRILLSYLPGFVLMETPLRWLYTLVQLLVAASYSVTMYLLFRELSQLAEEVGQPRRARGLRLCMGFVVGQAVVMVLAFLVFLLFSLDLPLKGALYLLLVPLGLLFFLCFLGGPVYQFIAVGGFGRKLYHGLEPQQERDTSAPGLTSSEAQDLWAMEEPLPEKPVTALDLFDLVGEEDAPEVEPTYTGQNWEPADLDGDGWETLGKSAEGRFQINRNRELAEVFVLDWRENTTRFVAKDGAKHLLCAVNGDGAFLLGQGGGLELHPADGGAPLPCPRPTLDPDATGRVRALSLCADAETGRFAVLYTCIWNSYDCGHAMLLAGGGAVLDQGCTRIELPRRRGELVGPALTLKGDVLAVTSPHMEDRYTYTFFTHKTALGEG